MEKTKFEKGMDLRRAILGKEHVERSLNAATDFSRPIQDLVTEYCWGDIWQRDGLPHNIRSMINIAMLTALNRPHELEVHLRAAFTNGVTVEEIREILMQTAFYCGGPAALESFRIAQRVINEKDETKKS